MKISDRHPLERPREKLARYGTARLSDLELLMAIIGSGNKQADVGKIAREVLKIVRQKGGDISYDDLRYVVGLGEAKIPVIVASLELARRYLLDSIIVAHNHPSGSLRPSEADVAVTRRLQDVGDLLGIILGDHIIVTAQGYKSIL